MNLTEHFSLAELTNSETAIRHGIPNQPTDPHILGNLHVLAAGLERIRAELGNVPLHITSGYRSPTVNRLVGSGTTSAHTKGLAADFVASGMTPRQVCQQLSKRVEALGIDQLIYEGTWVHVAFPESGPGRNQVLTAIFKPGVPVRYVEGVA